EPLLHRELGILDHKIVAEALPRFLANPTDVQLSNSFRNWRAQYADSLSLIRGDQLSIVLAMDLWTGYKMLRQANIRHHPMVDGEKQILTRIQGRLALAQGRDVIGPYIAATLYVAPSTLPAIDLSSLPLEIQEVLRS